MIQSRDRHILYVDDTEEQRYAMRRILESDGYIVHEAATGAEALSSLHPSILAVILDVKLPDISGYEVCRRIKADPATAVIPVLQVSASFADPTLRVQGLSGGADAYIAQPVHPAELLSLVRALIRSRVAELTLRFQAEASARLTASLNYDETLQTIEQVFVPVFADRCFVLLRPPEAAIYRGKPQARVDASDEFSSVHGDNSALPTDPDSSAVTPEHLRPPAREVIASGESRLLDPGTLIVPLEVGPRRLGALLFQLDGDRRAYNAEHISLAEDLADRSALALQNASLYSAQQSAQEALVQSEKLAAAGRLAAAMAHEINNPLEAITNLIFLIDTADETPPSIRTYAQEALSELSRLTHIARQSLGFYRELTGPSNFDLNESINDTLNIYLKRFEAKHIHIDRQCVPGPLIIRGVKGEIRQVISNLLVNALDALPAGGSLCIKTAEAGMPEDEAAHASPLSLKAGSESSGAPAVVFRICDNGSGIRAELLPRVFEPFFTTKQGTGTGLGLWVSDTIVSKHGGIMEVQSQTGEHHGTTFTVTLPVIPPGTSHETQPSDPQA